MPNQGKVDLTIRKNPNQRRSRQMVHDILEAATIVLRREGAHRFTTARVAEEAGASVGSVYQYFPNKEAILFRLQTEEWQRSSERAATILRNRSMSPSDRLRTMVHDFFDSELEELSIRTALGNAAPLYRDASSVAETRQEGRRAVTRFMEEALPDCSAKDRQIAIDVILTAIAAIGSLVSERADLAESLKQYASATADMACAYLATVAAKS